MIITLTLNPALDKTVEVSEFRIEALNKEIKTIKDPGGKGINVSKVLRNLEVESIATGFLGGDTGRFIEKALEELEIKSDFVGIHDETRTNLKIYDRSTEKTTELNELGPLIENEELETLMDKIIELADESTIVVLSGSAPNSVDRSIYKNIIKKLKVKSAKIILDADGDLLKQGIEGLPLIIKPNIHELEKLNSTKFSSTEEVVNCCRKYIHHGIQYVIVSMGAEGALLVSAEKVIKAHPLKVKAHSSVGAGDAFVGAIAYALQQGLEVEEMMKLAIATSAGAVMTEGTKPMNKAWIFENLKNVVLETLN